MQLYNCANGGEEMARKQITTTLDSNLLEKIKIEAIKEGKSVAYILDSLIEEYLKFKEVI